MTAKDGQVSGEKSGVVVSTVEDVVSSDAKATASRFRSDFSPQRRLVIPGWYFVIRALLMALALGAILWTRSRLSV